MDSRQALIDHSIAFLQQIKEMTPGPGMERWLNANLGPQSALYADLARSITAGVAEGWAADTEIAGPNLRRSLVAAPTPETFYFSLTAVYLNSRDARVFDDGDEVMRAGRHGHPYGEINLVVPVDAGAQLKGLQGWQGAGWTAPDPASWHHPEVRGGALISLTYLPAGRIAFEAKPAA
jgi:hypothetical protein